MSDPPLKLVSLPDSLQLCYKIWNQMYETFYITTSQINFTNVFTRTLCYKNYNLINHFKLLRRRNQITIIVNKITSLRADQIVQASHILRKLRSI